MPTKTTTLTISKDDITLEAKITINGKFTITELELILKQVKKSLKNIDAKGTEVVCKRKIK